MNKNIVLFPYSSKIIGVNPKDYPYWSLLVDALNKEGFNTIQLSSVGELRVPKTSEFHEGLNPSQILEKCKDAFTFVSVDSFAPHFLNLYKIYGIVIFAITNPKIFGYKENKNLLKSEIYLKKDQKDYNKPEYFDINSFVGVDDIVKEVLIKFKQQ